MNDTPIAAPSLDEQISAVRRADAMLVVERPAFHAGLRAGLRAALANLEAQKTPPEASCQQGAPCPDPAKCPDPIGCGHVGDPSPAQSAADEREAQRYADLLRRRQDVYSPLRNHAPYYGDDDIDLLRSMLDATLLSLSTAQRDLELARKEIARLTRDNESYRATQEQAIEDRNIAWRKNTQMEAELARLRSPPGADATIANLNYHICTAPTTAEGEQRLMATIEAAEARGWAAAEAERDAALRRVEALERVADAARGMLERERYLSVADCRGVGVGPGNYLTDAINALDKAPT